jgi:hypothetical protein
MFRCCFLQGTRDEFADLKTVGTALPTTRPSRHAQALSDADHSFHVPARTGRKDADVRAELLDAMAEWIQSQRG